MESHTSLAEDLPTLYRSILDGIAHLEAAGHRREAGLRRLGQIRQRIERLLAGNERPRRERSRGWRVGRNIASPQGGNV